MLKVDIHEETVNGKEQTACIVECAGDIIQICVDIEQLLGSLYANIKRQMPSLAESFRFVVTGRINDPDFWSDADDREAEATGTAILTAAPNK